MARTNLPPTQIPRKLLNDPELRGYFEAQSFAIYQLFQRTGGGEDIISGNQGRIDQNTTDILTNETNIQNNLLAITQNTTNIATNTANISTNTTNIAINTGDIAGLKETFSWRVIPSSDIVTIATNQQMIVADGMTIDGELIMNGDLSLI